MPVNETVLEVDLNALAHNYNYLREKVNPTVEFMAVVKAFAYGSAQDHIVKKLDRCGVDQFAVAYIKEGVALRKAGIAKPILVLHPQPYNFNLLVEHELMPCLYSARMLSLFIEFLKPKGLRNYPVHVEINTGMNRLGFALDEMDELKKSLLSATSLVNLRGVYGHFAASEDENERKFSITQIEAFKSAVDQLRPALNDRTLLHCCNTSGLLNYPEAHFDLVRPGIGLYGYGNAAQFDQELRPVASLKTLISKINHLKVGETLGYNRAFIAKQPTKTATLPLGHADGITRIYGHGKCVVRVNGKECPIIGNVCMDMIMVDVTGVKCREGDEVLIFGDDKSAEAFAQSAGTISYELITGIGQRVKRKIID